MQTVKPPLEPTSESASNEALSAAHRVLGIAEMRGWILMSLVHDTNNRTAGLRDLMTCRLVNRSWKDSVKFIANSEPLRSEMIVNGRPKVYGRHEAPAAWRDLLHSEGVNKVPRRLGGHHGRVRYSHRRWNELKFHPLLADVFGISRTIDISFQGDKKLSRGMFIFDGDICPNYHSGCCEEAKELQYRASAASEDGDSDDDCSLDNTDDVNDEVEEIRLSITQNLATWLKECTFFGYSSNPVTLFDLIPYRHCYLTTTATSLMAFYFGGSVDKTDGVRIPLRDLHECVARSKKGIRIGHLIVLCAMRHNYLKWGETKRGFVFDDEHMIIVEEEEDWYCTFPLEGGRVFTGGVLPADRELWISKVEGPDTFDPANREGVVVTDMWEGLEILGYGWIKSYYLEVAQSVPTNEIATVPATVR
ncbi:hypothetical protein DIS24_g11368 [Lasiodiplodia hormozganensis]|uniref:Uncharacterized protein n=1 Tax=Lasiodiplodia hormozganensis TaxID=869390 RepID=A0AA39WV25_9PEZI|nr:hypothetical protein DIS24_g11368 [Lasiodiplodia hormozganensis]